MEYDGKEFNDPILRCDQCSKITHRAFLSKYGGCNHCGNKRVRNVLGMSATEYHELRRGVLKIGIEHPYQIDPDFLALFEETKEVPSE